MPAMKSDQGREGAAIDEQQSARGEPRQLHEMIETKSDARFPLDQVRAEQSPQRDVDKRLCAHPQSATKVWLQAYFFGWTGIRTPSK